MPGRLQDLADDIDELYDLLISWIDNRQKCRKELIELADKMNEHQKNVNIAKTTGSSTAIVGTGLAIGGFVAAFFTFGTSLIVSAVGAGIASAGGITAGGAEIVKKLIDKNIYKDVQKSINRDQEITEKIQPCIDKAKVKVQSLKKCDLGKLNYEYVEWQAALKSTWYAACLGKTIVYDSIKTAQAVKGQARLAFAIADLTADTASTVFRSLSTVGRGLHIGGFVIGAVMVPLDIYTLVTSAISLHKGSVSAAEKKIRDIAQQMTCPDKDKVPGIIKAYV